jgi:hypothetical protein
VFGVVAEERRVCGASSEVAVDDEVIRSRSSDRENIRVVALGGASMLFLYRPRQTWMPFALPRNRTEQAEYNRELQDKFASTRRVAPAVPAASGRDPVAALKQLEELHQSGVLTDAEFESVKARQLAR